MEIYDIAVIGGGASGLMAAAAAAYTCRNQNTHAKIVILEKNARVGKKILATGNGRCNLTNMSVKSDCYNGDAGFIEPILQRYSAKKIIRVFGAMGLVCRELDGGRVYPYNLQASCVLNILRRQLDFYKVETVCGFSVSQVVKSPSGFVISSPGGSVIARRVIFASGGMACPQSGSDGKCFNILKALGHSPTKLFPALVQVRTPPDRVKALKGVRSMAAVTLKLDGKPVKTAEGEVQFTENGLSGICVFELSRFVGELKNAGNMEICLDFTPEYTMENVFSMLKNECETMQNLPALQLTEGFLNKAVGSEIIKSVLKEPSKTAGALSETEIRRIAETVKSFSFPVTGTLSWDKAQVTAGGVPLSEVNADMSSKVCNGLYLCGELLNIDGCCGGFNLHWAWASALAAGESAAQGLICAQ